MSALEDKTPGVNVHEHRRSTKKKKPGFLQRSMRRLDALDYQSQTALEEDITPIPLHFSEVIPMAKRYFHDIWQDVWSPRIALTTLPTFYS